MTLSGAFDQPKRATGSSKVFGLSPMVAYGVLAGVVGIGGAVAIYFTLVQPASLRVSQLQTEVETIGNEIRQKEAALRDRGKVEAELKQAEEQRLKLEAIFGDQQDLQVALLMIDQQIRDSGANLRSFKPGPVTTPTPAPATPPAGQAPATPPPAPATPPAEQANQAQPPAGLLQKVTYEVEFQGTFAQTLAVLRNIERLRLLLNITNFSMQAPAALDEDGEVPLLTTRFILEAFVPAAPAEQAAPPATPPATPGTPPATPPATP